MLPAVRTRRLLAAASVGAALVTSVAACGSGGGRPSDVITVSSNQCGGPWRLPGPGLHTFEISNQSTGGGEIDLIDPANGAVYDEIENIGPGTTRPMTLNVGSGRYAFLCLFNDFSPLKGVAVTVAGQAAGTPAVLPITYNDVIPLAKKYQAYTEAGRTPSERTARNGLVSTDWNTACGTGSPRRSWRRSRKRCRCCARSSHRATPGCPLSTQG